MRLKKIEIIGFKSFADKTSLEFNYGITGIVGPNGCGKSNISDAFRWVLGEQSAKSMRGNKMPDVIFAGTTKRKALNYAEVSITLNDIQGSLPIEYEEITITRRLHRSGESDYFLNRQPVRLKDVQSLLFDSGIGKNAFSIFEQGKIDQVINYTPLERRYIFEEAAGIVRFLQRKREALKKLEQVDLNINRVKDIHQEIEKQIAVLEQQAEKARIYKDKKSQLGSLEKGVLVARWENLEKKGSETGTREQEQLKQIAEISTQLEIQDKQLTAAKKNLLDNETTLQSRKEEFFKARSNKEIKTREHQSNQERLKEILTQEQKLQKEISALQETRKTRQSERMTCEKRQKETEKESAAQEKTLKSHREKTQANETEVSKLREQLKKMQQERFKLVQTESQFDVELKQNKIRLENTLERIQTLEKRKEGLSQTMADLMNQVADKQKIVREASQLVDDQRHTYNGLEKQLIEVTKQAQDVQKELNAIVQEITDGRARQKVLIRLREDMEGFSQGSKRLLQESTTEKSPLFGKLQGLHEYISSESGSEKALSAALRPYMQTLVVKTHEDLKLVLEFAQNKNIKDFSLICLENLASSAKDDDSEIKTKGVISLLSQVVDSKLAKHFLKKIYVTKDIDAALQLVKKEHGIEVLTNDGLFIDQHQVLFYTTQGENNIFLREAELKALDKKLKQIDAERSKIEQALKALLDKKTAIENERTEIDKAIRRSEMKLVEVNFGLQRVNGDMERSRQENKQMEGELQTLANMVEKLNSTLSQLAQKHQQAAEQAGEAQKLSSTIDTDLAKLVEKLIIEQRDLKDKEAAYQRICDENQRHLHTLSILDLKEQESQTQEKRIEESIQAGHTHQKKIQSVSSSYEEDLAQVEQALSSASTACQELDQGVLKQKTHIEQLEKKCFEGREKIKALESGKYQLGIQSAQCQSSSQAIEAELLERYHLTLPDARRLYSPLEKSLEQSERLIRTLRQELEAAGDINMTSIEECDKHKVRHTFLNQQMTDLSVSKHELVQIITELDKESRKIFKDTFEVINRNFKKNFKILFNGGEADLQFTETQDVLEAGVEIIAQPPGKQMRSINLLSGGEKCLTAMALLFAIFEVKPAPFCILDEIDAPLDDSNVRRFLNVVKQFVDRCQFIIITHNKCTMGIADVLFGVSMEEKGVSKILSMEFAEQSSPAGTTPQPMQLS